MNEVPLTVEAINTNGSGASVSFHNGQGITCESFVPVPDGCQLKPGIEVKAFVRNGMVNALVEVAGFACRECNHNATCIISPYAD